MHDLQESRFRSIQAKRWTAIDNVIEATSEYNKCDSCVKLDGSHDGEELTSKSMKRTMVVSEY